MPANRVEPAKCGGGELSDLSAGVEMGVLCVVITLSLRKNTSLVRNTEDRRHFHAVPHWYYRTKPGVHRTGLGCYVRYRYTEERNTASSNSPFLPGHMGRVLDVMAQFHPLPASPGEAPRLLL